MLALDNREQLEVVHSQRISLPQDLIHYLGVPSATERHDQIYSCKRQSVCPLILGAHRWVSQQHCFERVFLLVGIEVEILYRHPVLLENPYLEEHEWFGVRFALYNHSRC